MEKISLNFEFWRFCIDPEDEGIDQEWQIQDNQPYLEDKTRMGVPGCWDRKGAGDLSDYKGVAWFWRVFSLPESFEGKKYYLVIERMAHSATVFIDGEEIGKFQGAFLPFRFDISKCAAGEDHFLAIRIDARAEANRYVKPEIKEDDPLYCGIEEYSGIFGDVYIEMATFLDVEDLTLKTKLNYQADGTTINYAELTFELYIFNHSATDFKGKIHLNITRDYVAVAETTRDLEILAHNSRLSKIVFNVDLEPEDVWSPANPSIFNLAIKIMQGETSIIRIHKILGMRQLEYKNDTLHLNGKVFQGKGAIFPEYHPRFGYNLPSNYIHDELVALKEKGFSIIRPINGMFSLPLIELASRLGLLVIEDVPVVDLTAPEKNSFFTEYVNEVAFQPSVALWAINPRLTEKAESDPTIHRIVLDLEKLFNSRLDTSRYFVYKGNFGITEWERINPCSL